MKTEKKQRQNPSKKSTFIPEDKVAVTIGASIYLLNKETFEHFCRESHNKLGKKLKEYVNTMKLEPLSFEVEILLTSNSQGYDDTKIT